MAEHGIISDFLCETFDLEEDMRCSWCGSFELRGGNKAARTCRVCARVSALEKRISKMWNQYACDANSERILFRLLYYREIEQQRRSLGIRLRHLLERPEGDSLEYLFRHVARLAGAPEKRFFGLANTFTHDFNKDQRRLLAEMLLDVVRWGGNHERTRIAIENASNQMYGGRARA